MANELAAVLVPLGYVGAVIAVLCAVVAGVAIARGAAGLAGGAVGVWIPAALLSSTASFSSQWLPLIIAGASLGGMLVLGGIVRAVFGDGTQRREPEVLVEVQQEAGAVAPRPVALTSPTPALAN